MINSGGGFEARPFLDLETTFNSFKIIIQKERKNIPSKWLGFEIV